jgi:hypothetical protein
MNSNDVLNNLFCKGKNFWLVFLSFRVGFALCRPQERGRQCANCGLSINRDKKLSIGIFFSFLERWAKIKSFLSVCESLSHGQN